MRGLYSPADDAFRDLARSMISSLDGLYWIVDCQSGPIASDWIYASDENERMFEEMRIDVPSFESTSTQLWRPGSLARVLEVLHFDEWSYFVGFASGEADPVERATRIGFPTFTEDFFRSLESEGTLCALQVDGWWEFYPASDQLFREIQGRTCWREIVPRGPDTWSPEFV